MRDRQPREQRKRFVSGAEAQAFVDSGNADKGTFIFGSDSIQFIGSAEKSTPVKPAESRSRFNSHPTQEVEMQRSAEAWFTRRFGVID